MIHLINNFVIVLFCANYSKLIALEENIISVQQLPLCLPLFFVFSFEVLNSGIISCFHGVVFQDAVCEECFSIRLRCLHLLVFVTVVMRNYSSKLIFTSYLYHLSGHFFRFDTGIFLDACVLTKNFEQTTTGCSLFISDFVCHGCLQYFLFRTFVAMICWTSTEVLLNLVAPMDSAVLSLTLNKLNVFEVPLLISLVSAQCQQKLPWTVFLAFSLVVLLLTWGESIYGLWFWFH